MAMVAVIGLMKPAAIFSSGFGNSTIAFLMVFFMLSHVLSQVGFSRRMAIWFMTNKIAKKGPWAFVIMFLFGAMFVASFMSQTAALLIFVLLILMYRFLYRPDLSRMKDYDVSHLRESLPEMGKQE